MTVFNIRFSIILFIKSKNHINANFRFIFYFNIRCRSRSESIDQIGNRSFVMDMNGGSRHHNHPLPSQTHQSLANGSAREQWTKMPEPQNGLEHHQVPISHKNITFNEPV